MELASPARIRPAGTARPRRASGRLAPDVSHRRQGPLLRGLALGEVAQLSVPDLALQDHTRVGCAEVLVLAIWNGALALLGRAVLDIAQAGGQEVVPLRHLVQRELAGENAIGNRAGVAVGMEIRVRPSG